MIGGSILATVRRYARWFLDGSWVQQINQSLMINDCLNHSIISIGREQEFKMFEIDSQANFQTLRRTSWTY